MSANEFDELIKAKFDKNEFAYNPANWDLLSQQMKQLQQPRKNNIVATWPALAGIAATVALIMVLPMLWQQANDEQPIVMEKNAANTAPAVVAQKAEPPVEETNTNATTVPGKNKIVAIPLKKTAQKKTSVNTTQPIVANNNTETTNRQNQPVSANQKPKPALERPVNGKLYADINTPDVENKNRISKKVTIDLVGGVNYNANVSGYTFGASANRKLGNKLYIEGNIAYVNNNINQGRADKALSAQNFEDRYDTNPGTSGVKTSTPAPTVLSYVQVTPVVGYQVSKRFNIGAGPDFQQMVNTGSALSQVYSTFDMGVLAKAEYGITKKLKAGIQYRNAVNKLLKTETTSFGTKTEERNYMQVQIKYSIFNK
jgi:hypothetical protein